MKKPLSSIALLALPENTEGRLGKNLDRARGGGRGWDVTSKVKDVDKTTATRGLRLFSDDVKFCLHHIYTNQGLMLICRNQPLVKTVSG
jgi:hypothetical protein